MTFAVGSNVKFASGKKLTVYGTLNATNTTFTGATSSTYWGGIIYQSGSSGLLDNCTINQVQTSGGGAIVINNSSPQIKDCTISNNISTTSGIQVLSNAYPYIHHNTINSSTYHGIYINHASGYLRYNTITASTSGGNAAVYCYNYANPLFGGIGGGEDDGYNILQNSFFSIYANSYCSINMGTSSNARYNSLLNPVSYNAYASGNSTIYAKNNYWSPTAPTKVSAASGSYVYWDPQLSSPPSASISTKDNFLHVISSSGEDQLLLAMDFRMKGDYSQAIAIYKNIIETQGPLPEAKIAIVELGNTYKETKEQSILNYLNNLAAGKDDKNNLRPILYEVLAGVYSSDGLTDNARGINEKLLEEYPNSIHEKNGLMNLFYHYYNSGQFEEAKEMLTSINSSFKNEEEFNAAGWLYEAVTGEKIEQSPSPEKDYSNEGESVSLNLEGNYPNPFNPTTQIKFTLPETSMVKLEVFNILGECVAELLNKELTAGSHTVNFNAENLPSGIYIYNLTAGSFSESRKMVLLK